LLSGFFETLSRKRFGQRTGATNIGHCRARYSALIGC
jgi:hypothetical protein